MRSRMPEGRVMTVPRTALEAPRVPADSARARWRRGRAGLRPPALAAPAAVVSQAAPRVEPATGTPGAERHRVWADRFRERAGLPRAPGDAPRAAEGRRRTPAVVPRGSADRRRTPTAPVIVSADRRRTRGARRRTPAVGSTELAGDSKALAAASRARVVRTMRPVAPAPPEARAQKRADREASPPEARAAAVANPRARPAEPTWAVERARAARRAPEQTIVRLASCRKSPWRPTVRGSSRPWVRRLARCQTGARPQPASTSVLVPTTRSSPSEDGAISAWLARAQKPPSSPMMTTTPRPGEPPRAPAPPSRRMTFLRPT